MIGKFRTQLKKLKISVEKAYKIFDPNNYGRVQKRSFVDDCLGMNLQFTEDELEKIFIAICQTGDKKGGDDANPNDRDKTVTHTRFNYKQLQEAILAPGDENWLYQSCIRIHSMALQKGLSYKRLFNQWKDKASKSPQGKLNDKELGQGLKRLKAGLSNEEIEKLVGALPYDSKDGAISAVEFEKYVLDAARKLEAERSYQNMIL